MTIRLALARLGRGLKSLWRALRARFAPNRPGWGSPPQDDAHAYYRTQYERLIETLPNLPRTKDNETSATFLAFAQVVQQLHEFGDDPVMPPGIKRIVVRETERLARFGDIGRPSLLGALAPTLPYVAAAGVLLSITGWGGAWWNDLRADRAEARAERNGEIANWNYQQWQRAHERAELRLEALSEAQELARQTADALTAERRARDRAAARERRRNSEIANVLARSPDAPAWRLRDDDPAPGR